MSILNFGTHPDDFGGNPGPDLSTNPAQIDMNYSPHGIIVTGGAYNANSFCMVPFGSEVSDLWFHGRFHYVTTNTLSAIETRLAFLNEAGQIVASVYRPSGSSPTFVLRAIGDSTVESGWMQVPANGTTQTLDFHVETGENITVSLFVNGSLAATAQAANTGNRAGPNRVEFGNIFSSTTHTCVVSEIIVTDGDSTLGWRLASLDPGVAGEYDEMQGGVAQLLDRDWAAAVVSTEAFQQFSWLPTAYGGAAEPASVVAVASSVWASRNTEELPNALSQTIRLDGNDHTGSMSLIGALDRYLQIWEENPETESAWEIGDIEGMEVGVISTNFL